MMIKKLLMSIFCLVILIMSISTNSLANSDGKKLLGYNDREIKSMAKFDESFLINENKSSEQYNKLNESFGKIEMRKSSDYTDYYGGAYIDQNGKLVVYLTDDSASNKQDIKKRIGNDDFIVKKSKHSYKTLTKIMDTLNDYKFKNPNSPISANFNSYCLLDDQNVVTVYLDECNEEQINAFKKQVIDSSAIEFKQGTCRIKTESSINPG